MFLVNLCFFALWGYIFSRVLCSTVTQGLVDGAARLRPSDFFP